MERPRIAVFDSGVGGLTVLSELRQSFPSAHYFYLGDSARAPYGVKTEETIRRYVGECLNFLLQFEPDCVVVACNSVSSVALSEVKKSVSVPVIETVEPVSRKAAQESLSRSLLLLGTPATLRSGSYQASLKRVAPDIVVTGKACPLFVPLVEEGLFQGRVVDEVLELYLEPFRSSEMDTIILGCTHYPFLSESIEKFFKGSKKVLCCGKPMADELVALFPEAASSLDEGSVTCFTTDPISPFNRISKTLLDSSITCRVVSLEEKVQIDLGEAKRRGLALSRS